MEIFKVAQKEPDLCGFLLFFPLLQLSDFCNIPHIKDIPLEMECIIILALPLYNMHTNFSRIFGKIVASWNQKRGWVDRRDIKLIYISIIFSISNSPKKRHSVYNLFPHFMKQR